jgi:hypothetical protein
MWCLHRLLVDSSMEPAALLACINPPLLPLLYRHDAGRVCHADPMNGNVRGWCVQHDTYRGYVN